MVIKNQSGAIVGIKLSFVAAGELKEYIKGNLEFDAFWADFSKVATKLVETAFSPKVMYPISVNFKGLILTMNEPYTLNSVVGMHHGGSVEAYGVTLIDEKKKKSVLTTEKLKDGVFIETPLCLIISAQLKKLFATLRQSKSYDSWTMAGKLRSQQMIDSINTQLEQFKEHPAISFLFPEVITVVDSGRIMIASTGHAPWLNGVKRFTAGEISSSNTLLLTDFMNKSVDLYKGIYGVSDTISALQSKLNAYGVMVTVPNEWVGVEDQEVLIGTITPEFRKYLEVYPEQILATFPYYIRHAYGGMDLTGNELSATLYDFSRVLNKFTNRTIKYKAENLFTNVYELMAVIMKGIGKPMSLIDISDFIIYHNLRMGSISFKTTTNVPNNMTLDDLNKLKELSKNLTSPAKNLAGFQGGLTKNAAGNLQLAYNGKIFEFEVVVGEHIVNKSEVVDCILSNRSLGFDAVEVLECIEGLYLACLNPTIKAGDLYNFEEGKFKYTIPAVYLNSQLHPGFVVSNFNIYIPGNL